MGILARLVPRSGAETETLSARLRLTGFPPARE